MLKDLSILSSEILSEVNHIAGTSEQADWFNRNLERAYKKYNVPRELAAEILNGSKTIDSPFLGFVFANLLNEQLVTEFFTDAEIAVWKGSKYQTDEMTEIKIPMLQVASNQWIGAISLIQLIEIDEHHLMRYNENTQRVLRKKTYASGDVVYEPYINQSAVNQIYRLLENETYIPNTITFNMIDPDMLEYRNGTVIISDFKKDTPVFDILDGYHRFRAMKKMHMTNPKFDYPMELRIVAFSEERAKQFIWQEDQKTRMRRIDSKAFNQDAAENRIVSELNDSGPFRGLLTTTGKQIDTPLFAAAVRQIYFKRGARPDRAEQIEVRRKIIDGARNLEETDPVKFERDWSISDIVSFIIATKYYKSEDCATKIVELKSYAEANDLFKRKSNLKYDINKLIAKTEEV